MNGVTYVRYEVLRSLRNWRFLILSLAFPLVLYYSVAGANRHKHLQGIAFSLGYMAAMMALGTMAAVISSCAVIAIERSTGWTRQMRITPLGTGTYLGAKVLIGYLRAAATIAVMCLSGVALGVRLPAGQWAVMIGLLLAGLVPFTVLGILLGHLFPADSVGVAMGGTVMVFSLLGGAYGFQVANSGALFDVIKAIPSFWLVQAAKAAIRLSDWPAEGWTVTAAWTAALIPLALLAYQRDTRR
jgi:ABC-2 type transport system permease protein